jgi:hypothetical protein
VHAQIVMEAIQSTMPRDIQNMVMEAQQLKDFQRWMGNENKEFTYQILVDCKFIEWCANMW